MVIHLSKLGNGITIAKGNELANTSMMYLRKQKDVTIDLSNIFTTALFWNAFYSNLLHIFHERFIENKIKYINEDDNGILRKNCFKHQADIVQNLRLAEIEEKVFMEMFVD